MAAEAAMMAQQRSARMDANDTAASGTKPVFTQAKLRKTPTRSGDATAENTTEEAPQLRSVSGGIDTRAPPKQLEDEIRQAEEEAARAKAAEPPPEPEPEIVEWVQGPTTYKTTVLEKTEPKVVTTKRVIQHDPEYGTWKTNDKLEKNILEMLTCLVLSLGCLNSFNSQRSRNTHFAVPFCEDKNIAVCLSFWWSIGPREGLPPFMLMCQSLRKS